MASTDETINSRPMKGTESRIRIGGVWLAIGSVLFVVGLLLHPPPSPNPSEFMATIAQDPGRWMAAHGVTIIGLIFLTVAGLIILTTPSRLTEHGLTTTAWAAVIIGSVLIMTAAFLEATVITSASVTGDTATFSMWNPFAEAHAFAILLVSLGIAVIAINEARTDQGLTAQWAAWIGTIAGLLSAGGFVLGIGLGIAFGGVLWLISTLVMSLWTLWLGVALARVDGYSLTSSGRWAPTD